MKSRRAILFPLAALGSAVNVVAVWFAAVPAEPLHATIHAALAVAFALWAQRLGTRPRASSSLADRLEDADAFRALESEVATLREALAESQAALGTLGAAGMPGGRSDDPALAERPLADLAPSRRHERP